jgi:hypothetical protein
MASLPFLSLGLFRKPREFIHADIPVGPATPANGIHAGRLSLAKTYGFHGP